ncbi:MAG: hypothetical protein ABI056_08295 [Caulobacteraceae bacterium]
MSRYEPLTRYLESRADDAVMLSFAEVEKLIRRPLPDSARKHQAWWANTGSHSHAAAWLRPGWRTSHVSLQRERVTLAREKDASRSGGTASRGEIEVTAGDRVQLPLHDLTIAGRRLIADYAEEAGGDVSAAVTRAIHEAAIARRARMLRQWLESAPRMPPGEPDSVAMIREDRDGR